MEMHVWVIRISVYGCSHYAVWEGAQTKKSRNRSIWTPRFLILRVLETVSTEGRIPGAALPEGFGVETDEYEVRNE
jgi:hypothetical protein